MSLRVIFALLFSALLISCGNPGPTDREVSKDELLGTWFHEDTQVSGEYSTLPYRVTLVLVEDGTFTQEIKAGSLITRSAGTWQLTDSRISFDNILLEDTGSPKWKNGTADWWFVNWYGEDRKVALFGSLNGDPDSYAP